MLEGSISEVTKSEVVIALKDNGEVRIPRAAFVQKNVSVGAEVVFGATLKSADGGNLFAQDILNEIFSEGE
jgi:hypothetical protein